MADGAIIVQSIAPGEGYPVAVDTRVLASGQVAAVQHVLGVDARSDVAWTVRSYAQGNPLAVALTDPAGGHVTAVSAWLANTPSVVVANPTLAAVASAWVANTPAVTIAGLPTVVATLPGPTAAVGSTWVANTPSVVVAGQPLTAVVSAWLANTPAVTLAGMPTVVATLSGPTAVVGSAWIANTPSVVVAAPVTVTGTVTAVAPTSVWLANTPAVVVAGGTVVASVIGTVSAVATVTQATSPWIVQIASGAAPLGTVVASVVGPVSAVATVTQATSPWIVQLASGGNPLGAVVASVIGVPTVVGSVLATAAGSWGVQVFGVQSGIGANVRSWGTGGLLMVSVEQGNLSAGANGAVLDFANPAIGATVTSFAGAAALNVSLTSSGGVHATVASDALGGLLNVNVARGNVTLTGANGALLDFVNPAIGATVRSMANAATLLVTLTDTVGNTLWPLVVVGSVSVTGSVGATITGSVAGTVVASVIGVAAVTGSVTATQGNPPWAVVGSVAATQATSPWIVQVASGAQPLGTVVASVSGTVSAVATVTQATSPWIVQIASGGQPLGTVVASVIGLATVLGSVVAAQAGPPWTVVGSAVVTGPLPVGSLWPGSGTNPLLVGALAYPAGGLPPAVNSLAVVQVLADPAGRLRVVTDAASIVGPVIVVASVIGVPAVVGSVAVTQASSPWVTQLASSNVFLGGVVASVAGVAAVAGSVAATQASSPWIVQIASGAQPLGTVVASVVGPVSAVATVTQATSPWIVQIASGAAPLGAVVASVAGVPTIIGSVAATQVTSPWIVQIASGAAPLGTVVASVVGVVATVASVTQATSPWIVQIASGAQPLGTVVASVVGGVSVVGTVATVPAVRLQTFLPLAAAVSSLLAFPYDGNTATLPGPATTTAVLGIDPTATFVNSDPTGFLVVVVQSGSPALGAQRRVVGWAAGTSATSLYLALDSAWLAGALPQSGDRYRLLLDCRGASVLQVKTELSSATNTLAFAAALYDYPQNAVGSPRPPVTYLLDQLWTDNQATSWDVWQASYFHGTARQVTLSGVLGAKVCVQTLTGGRFALWAAVA